MLHYISLSIIVFKFTLSNRHGLGLIWGHGNLELSLAAAHPGICRPLKLQ